MHGQIKQGGELNERKKDIWDIEKIETKEEKITNRKKSNDGWWIRPCKTTFVSVRPYGVK